MQTLLLYFYTCLYHISSLWSSLVSLCEGQLWTCCWLTIATYVVCLFVFTAQFL